MLCILYKYVLFLLFSEGLCLSVLTSSDLCMLSFRHNVVQMVLKVLKAFVKYVCTLYKITINTELNSFLYLLVVAV